MYSIQEAMFLFEHHGTITECDADKHIVTVYDDDEDQANKWIIDRLHY
jgi:hypothetical protein